MTTENKFQVGDEVEGRVLGCDLIKRGKIGLLSDNGNHLVNGLYLDAESLRLISRPTPEADRLCDACGDPFPKHRSDEGFLLCNQCYCVRGSREVDAMVATRRKSLAQPAPVAEKWMPKVGGDPYREHQHKLERMSRDSSAIQCWLNDQDKLHADKLARHKQALAQLNKPIRTSHDGHGYRRTVVHAEWAPPAWPEDASLDAEWLP